MLLQLCRMHAGCVVSPHVLAMSASDRHMSTVGAIFSEDLPSHPEYTAGPSSAFSLFGPTVLRSSVIGLIHRLPAKGRTLSELEL